MWPDAGPKVPDERQGAWAQHAADLGQAGRRVGPVVHRQRADNQVERSVREGQRGHVTDEQRRPGLVAAVTRPMGWSPSAAFTYLGCRRCGLQRVDQPARFGVEGPHRDQPALGVVSQPSRRGLRGGEERLLRADVGVDAVQSKGEVGVEVDRGDDRGGRVDALHPLGVMSTVIGVPVAGQVATAWIGRPSARASRYMSTLEPLPAPTGRPPACTR